MDTAAQKLWDAITPALTAQQADDMRLFGMTITRGGERVDPRDVFIGPPPLAYHRDPR